MNPNPVHILYVEDDAEDREVFKDALEEVAPHCVCHLANDGHAGLSLLETLLIMPDFIFLDVNMPVMDGREVLQRVKTIPRLRTIPVMMYSTTSHPQERKIYFEMGASDVLTKPSSYADLSKLLSKILSSAKNDSRNVSQLQF